MESESISGGKLYDQSKRESTPNLFVFFSFIHISISSISTVDICGLLARGGVYSWGGAPEVRVSNNPYIIHTSKLHIALLHLIY